MRDRLRRAALVTLGVLSLGLGGLGILLPLLPTTPFVLLAAFAFAKSSDRLHQWLLSHRVFGPMIADWQRYGAIGRNAKIAGVVSSGAIVVASLLFGMPTHAIMIQVVVLGAVVVFILSRPAPPEL